MADGSKGRRGKAEKNEKDVEKTVRKRNGESDDGVGQIEQRNAVR